MLNKTLRFCDGDADTDADAGVTAIARTIRSNSRAKNWLSKRAKIIAEPYFEKFKGHNSKMPIGIWLVIELGLHFMLMTILRKIGDNQIKTS